MRRFAPELLCVIVGLVLGALLALPSSLPVEAHQDVLPGVSARPKVQRSLLGHRRRGKQRLRASPRRFAGPVRHRDPRLPSLTLQPGFSRARTLSRARCLVHVVRLIQAHDTHRSHASLLIANGFRAHCLSCSTLRAFPVFHESGFVAHGPYCASKRLLRQYRSYGAEVRS